LAACRPKLGAILVRKSRQLAQFAAWHRSAPRAGSSSFAGSTALQTSEGTDDELNPGIIVQSAGIPAREDHDSISLALDWYPQQKLWRRIQHIPKPYIFELRKITV
jgi:hypothetical protein